MSKNKNKIGIFGGSFDPPHKGHLRISSTSIKKLNLKKVYWIVTKKNPFKKKKLFSLKEIILKCLKLTKKNKKIYVKSIDDKIKSCRTFTIIKHFRKKNKNDELYLIIGSDNLISFHKWDNWKIILKDCHLVVYPRKGFDKKARKSKIIRHIKNKNIIFIKGQKVDISSTKVRKQYQKNIR